MDAVTDVLRERAGLVGALSTFLNRGGLALKHVPPSVGRLITEEAWRDFTTKSNRTVHYDRFIDFVTTPPLAGLGATPELLLRLCEGTEAEPLLKRALDGEQPLRASRGRPPTSNVANSKITDGGTTEDYTRRRLARDRPDLYEQVLEGVLSSNAAAIEAGFRTKTITVPTVDPARIAATLRRNLAPEVLAAVLTELS